VSEPFKGQIRWTPAEKYDYSNWEGGDGRVFGVMPQYEGRKKYFLLEQFDGAHWNLMEIEE
jgi:hypothetical protein